MVKFRRSDLVLTNLGPRSGTEPGKIRPAVVVQTNFLNELSHRSTIVVLCTSRLKGEHQLRTRLPKGSSGNELETEVLIDQIFALENRKILRKLGTVPDLIFADIEEKLRLVLGFDFS